jgi:threonine/homoserine/homoserine lactone efflux protein
MNAAAWFVAGWLCASVFIYLGIYLWTRWTRVEDEPHVYTAADLERAVQRRQGLR